MSEFYEGIVTVGDQERVSAGFHSIVVQRAMRLVSFGNRVFGLYPLASRSDRINEAEIDEAATHLSKVCGNALVVLYDNRVGIRVAKLFRDGNMDREFGELDEKWVPLDDNGNPDPSHRTLSANELDDDDEYDCVQDAISLGLARLGVANSVTLSDLKSTFCYDQGEVVAERKGF